MKFLLKTALAAASMGAASAEAELLDVRLGSAEGVARVELMFDTPVSAALTEAQGVQARIEGANADPLVMRFGNDYPPISSLEITPGPDGLSVSIRARRGVAASAHVITGAVGSIVQFDLMFTDDRQASASAPQAVPQPASQAPQALTPRMTPPASDTKPGFDAQAEAIRQAARMAEADRARMAREARAKPAEPINASASASVATAPQAKPEERKPPEKAPASETKPRSRITGPDTRLDPAEVAEAPATPTENTSRITAAGSEPAQLPEALSQSSEPAERLQPPPQPVEREIALEAAASLLDGGVTEEVCQEARQAVSDDGWNLDALVDLGVCLSADGDHEGAMTVFRRLLSFDPTSYRAHVGLASAAQLAGDKSLARRHYSAALNNNPTSEVEQNVRQALRAL